MEKLTFIMPVFLVLNFCSFLAHANVDACFCETGLQPTNQTGFFHMGCKIWLNAQKDCTDKQIVEQNYDYIGRMDMQKYKSVRLSYVGHWASAAETVQYLDQSIRPMLNKGLSVQIENTACKSMDKPELVLDFVKSLNLPQQQNLDVIGNQTDSVGEWTVIIGKSNNFTAEVSSNNSNVIFPSCKTYQGKNCMQNVQLGQSGQCLDANQQMQILTCCQVEQENQRFAWDIKANCL